MQVAPRRTWLAAQIITAQIVAATLVAIPVQAQATAAGSIAITAQIASPLSLLVTHPMDFGRLLASTTKTVAPNGATSGRFELTGQGGSSVTVTLAMPATLNPPSGPNLSVSAWTYLAGNTAGLSGSPIAFNAGTPVSIPLVFESVAGATKMYFGIGASVSAAALQPSAVYTGTGQITAAYTDL